MSKRFTDTEKWDRPWFRNLPPLYKCFWEYLRDKCDSSGVWYVDFELASYLIKKPIHRETALKLFEKQINLIGDGSRWFIPSFCPFQYGELKPNNNAHISILRRHEALGLLEKQDLGYHSGTPHEGTKNKNKKILSLGSAEGFERFWQAYPKKKSKGAAEKAFEKCQFTNEQLDAVISAIERAKTSNDWQKDDGQFIPYPASWLNAKGWEDDYTPMVEKRSEVVV